ncbi:MAG: CDP-glucose 4,6-dehydratase [Petrotoga sp.]|jgi:CDP-glucose 4,6-dehydratase|nr:CDP-glucose 4,6-dehydratase [Petrotoga sp.]
MFEFYKNIKVLVTGHTGFKGSWLTIWLLQKGAKVVGYALDPTNNNDNFVRSNLADKITDYRRDIRDFNDFQEIVDKENPEIIFHLAAQPLVLKSYENPLYTIQANTLGTANVLEAFRQSKSAKVLILVTTDKVYKNNEWDWGYREIDQLGGYDPYSGSKAAAEMLIQSYDQSFFSSGGKYIATVRAGNVIGGGDWSENRIVPDCIKAIENDVPIVIRNPQAIRPWQHVLEPLGGYLLLAEHLLIDKTQYKGAWNFGPFYSNIVNVEQLVQALIKNYGKGDYYIQSEGKIHQESSFLSLDISKALNKLKWKPVLQFNETIEFTIDWYKRYNFDNVFDLCCRQIEEYEYLWKLRNSN